MSPELTSKLLLLCEVGDLIISTGSNFLESMIVDGRECIELDDGEKISLDEIESLEDGDDYSFDRD